MEISERSKPDGQMRRANDVLRAVGVGPGRTFRDGLAETYAWSAGHVDEAGW